VPRARSPVEARIGRDLSAKRFPFVLVDALVFKVREDGRERSCSALLAMGINEDGYREILGPQLGDSESERSLMDFFTWLKGRGRSGVDLIVSDHHGGLTTAVRVQFQGASWQRCQPHLSASVSSAAPKAVQEELHDHVRAIFEAPDLPTARTLLAQVVAPTTTSRHRPRLPPWSAVLTMPPPC
jgi:putative transposase